MALIDTHPFRQVVIPKNFSYISLNRVPPIDTFFSKCNIIFKLILRIIIAKCFFILKMQKINFVILMQNEAMYFFLGELLLYYEFAEIYDGIIN